MKKLAIILIFFTLGCGSSDDEVIDSVPFATDLCLPSSALIAHVLDDENLYFLLLEFEYLDDKLVEIRQYEDESNELVFTTTFEYEGDRVSRVEKSNWLVSYLDEYSYTEDSRTITQSLTVPETGETFSFDFDYYEPDISTDGIYYNTFVNTVYEVVNGNVVREGGYEVVAGDTTYTFTIEHEYDDRPNFHLSEPYLFTLNHSFLYSIAERLSANNLIKTTFDNGSEFTPYNELLYDNVGNLRAIELATDQLYEFIYPCAEN